MRALPGARELLQTLTDERVPWAIATSGLLESARPALELLHLPAEATIILTRVADAPTALLVNPVAAAR